MIIGALFFTAVPLEALWLMTLDFDSFGEPACRERSRCGTHRGVADTVDTGPARSC